VQGATYKLVSIRNSKLTKGRYQVMNYPGKHVGLWALILATVSCIPVSAAKPNQCTPASAAVTIHDIYADPTNFLQYNAGIRSDGQGEYVDGVGGVSALIRDCPNGTGDLTFGTGGSK
jgi:hypothetical protein